MFTMFKKALKIGAGVVIITAIASGAAGFFQGKRRAYKEMSDDGGDDEDEHDKGRSSITRKQAFKDMMRAGLMMKSAWNRIERDAKIIASETAKNVVGDDDEEEDES
jgi:hypothetical protein